jgi:hypothetical protein
MKTLKAFLILTTLLLCLYACKKPGAVNPVNPGSVVGKWNIVSVASSTGVGANNHVVNYAGQPGDYFEFASNGTLYTKEGTVLDTLNYTMDADTSIILKTPGNTSGIPQPGRITTFTAHSLVIYGPYSFTYGGTFGNTTSLSR